MPHVGERDAQVHLGVERVGFEPKRTSIEIDRPFGPVVLPEDDSQIIEDPKVILIELIRPEEIRHGLRRAALLPDCRAQVVEHVGVVGIEAECLAKASLGLGTSSFVQQFRAFEKVSSCHGMGCVSRPGTGQRHIPGQCFRKRGHDITPSGRCHRSRVDRLGSRCWPAPPAMSTWIWPRVKRDRPTLPSPI